MDAPQRSPSPYTPPVTPAPAPLPTPPPASSHTGLLVGILAAVVVLAAAAYYFVVLRADEVATVSPSPSVSTTPFPTATADSTADWKTYTNAQYGFEFKYPSNLESNEVVMTSGSNFYDRYVSIDVDTPEAIERLRNPGPGSGGVSPLFRFGAFYPKAPRTWSSDLGCKGMSMLDIDGTAITVCGENITTLGGTGAASFTRDNIVLFSGGGSTMIAKQILSTFKFTK